MLDSLISAPSPAINVPFIVALGFETVSSVEGDMLMICGSPKITTSSVGGTVSDDLEITISGDTPTPDLGGT